MPSNLFGELPQVLNHYSSEIKQSSTLDQSLTNGIALNNTEKQQLIAFLKTLTDREFINDPRFKEAN